MNHQLLAALGEPHRFEIVELLRNGPRPVSEIVDHLGLKQSQVSQHLRVLRDVGLVDVEPRAQQRLYGLRGLPMQQVHEWLERYRRIWDEQFDQLEELVQEVDEQAKAAKGDKP